MAMATTTTATANDDTTKITTSTITSTLSYPPIHKDAKFVVLSDCMYMPIIPFHPVGYGFPDMVVTSGSLLIDKGDGMLVV